MDGNKILRMSVENFRLLDSLNLMPVCLKSIPKSVDLTWNKGYYIRFFNKAKNWAMWDLISTQVVLGKLYVR